MCRSRLRSNIPAGVRCRGRLGVIVIGRPARMCSSFVESSYLPSRRDASRPTSPDLPSKSLLPFHGTRALTPSPQHTGTAPEPPRQRAEALVRRRAHQRRILRLPAGSVVRGPDGGDDDRGLCPAEREWVSEGSGLSCFAWDDAGE